MSERPVLEVSPIVEANKTIFDCGISVDVGKVRDHNEDTAGVFENQAGLPERGIDGLYIVADGMGGHAAGEVASAISVDVILQQCGKREFPRQVKSFSQLTQDEKRQWISEVISQANQAIFNRSKSEGNDMGSTTVMAIRSGDEVAIANVGDSRAYMISKDGKGISQATKDHSLVSEMVRKGIITEEEARDHPQKNVIIRTMGHKPQVEVDVFFAKIPSGGSMILCSDGLSGMVDDGQIRKIVTSALSSSDASKKLIDAANAAGGQDNISAIVVKNTGRMAEKSADVRKDKEWKETMQDMLQDPIAKTVYLRTGSLTASAVAHEYRDEIISGRMDKAKYLEMVKRAKRAAKN